ncbi:MAG: cytochrome c biogenesis CcdA family protein [Armatimonadota bacterium]
MTKHACRLMRPAYLTLIALILLLLIWSAGASPAAPPIHAYYFTAPMCPGCDKANNLMTQLLPRDTQVVVHTLNVYEPREYEMAEALLTVAGLPKRELPLGPALLVGETYINRANFRQESILKALEAYRATGAPDITSKALPLRGHARESLPQELRHWGLLPFLLAGLLDGINPCAFATLVFFLSYLGMVGMQGRSLLKVGLAYAAGVFGAYFAFGLGLLHALWFLDSMPLLRWALFLVMAAVSLVFAGLSYRDYRHIQQGDFSSVALQLPSALKRQTHAAIRKGLRASLLYPSSFLMGAGVAALELACTGQVYVPALIYMLSLGTMRATATIWLLLYDLMFVTPLLILLVVVSRGTSSKRLQGWAETQVGKTKLYLAVFFAVCAVYFLLQAAMP